MKLTKKMLKEMILQELTGTPGGGKAIRQRKASQTKTSAQKSTRDRTRIKRVYSYNWWNSS